MEKRKNLVKCLQKTGLILFMCLLNSVSLAQLASSESDALPDLRVTSIYTEYSNTYSCRLVVLIKNVGVGPVNMPFDVDIFFGQAEAPVIGELSDYYLTHLVNPSSPIHAGDVVKVYMNVPSLYYGGHQNAAALVDSTRTIDESNEGNNHWYQCSGLLLDCLN